jgi:hypothetical protein
MKTLLKIFPIAGVVVLISCSVTQKQTNSPSIGYILQNCKSLKGKEVELIATYKGWHCPKNCPNPGITRSDTCWVDNTGCIYSKGFGDLNPLKDINKTYKIRAIVEESEKGICYLRIKQVEGLKRK